jgi:hypothetical protein
LTISSLISLSFLSSLISCSIVRSIPTADDRCRGWELWLFVAEADGPCLSSLPSVPLPSPPLSTVLYLILSQHYEHHREPWLSFYWGAFNQDQEHRLDLTDSSVTGSPQSHSCECGSAKGSSLRKVMEIPDLFRFLSEYM